MENKKQSALFKEIFGKKVEVDFDGGEFTSDAGVLFLRQTEEKLGIIERVAGVLRDRRHPGYVKHQFVELLRQRVFQIACGYEDGNDANDLRVDPVMKMACERLPISDAPLASQPTISRFENAPSRTDLYRLAETFLEGFIASYKTAPQAIILDFDETADPTHGHQQLALFNAFHDNYCYLPLHVYEGKSGKLITTILRPGKRPSGKETVAILKRLVKRLRAAWPTVGILLRGDAHYSAPEVFDFCYANNLQYVLGLTSKEPMLKQASALVKLAKQHFVMDNQPVQLFGEFHYQAASWGRPERIIVKAEHNEKGANPRFLVTNLEGARPRFIYQTIYASRGRAELWIKEHKTHLLSDRTSCCRFEANQFRLFLHSLAYVLLQALRELHLKGTELASAQFNTLQKRLLKIGARVRQLSTKIKISLPSSFPLKEEFYKICLSVT